jgi:hypothetical protein
LKSELIRVYAFSETALGRSGPGGAARTRLSSDAKYRCQVPAQPPAKTTAGLIKKETNEHRTLNVEHRILYSINLKKMPNKAIFVLKLCG